jgi:hypothetical protein
MTTSLSSASCSRLRTHARGIREQGVVFLRSHLNYAIAVVNMAAVTVELARFLNWSDVTGENELRLGKNGLEKVELLFTLPYNTI